MDPDIEEFLIEKTIVPLASLRSRAIAFEAEYLELFDESYVVPEIRAINESEGIVDRFSSEMEKLCQSIITT